MFESNQKLSRSGTTFLKRENKVLQIGNLPKAINSQFQSKCLAINNVMKSLYVLTVYSKFLNLQKWRFPWMFGTQVRRKTFSHRRSDILGNLTWKTWHHAEGISRTLDRMTFGSSDLTIHTLSFPTLNFCNKMFAGICSWERKHLDFAALCGAGARRKTSTKAALRSQGLCEIRLALAYLDLAFAKKNCIRRKHYK